MELGGMKGKIYSAKEINNFAAKKEEKWLKIDRGLFVVVAPEPTNSRRVVGKVDINKKSFKYSFGSLNKSLKGSTSFNFIFLGNPPTL